jgi:hypothetical protein
MANEITILEGNGSFRFGLFLIFPIASPQQVGGANVVPTPATNDDGTSALPPMADTVLAAAEKAALDAGTAAYRVIQFRKDPTLTGAQLLALVRQKYAEEEADFSRWYSQTYLHAGQRLDA